MAYTFGEKDRLFSKALALYWEMVAGNLASMFDAPSVEAIFAVFVRVNPPAENEDLRKGGCLAVNTVFEIELGSEPGKVPDQTVRVTTEFGELVGASLVWGDFSTRPAVFGWNLMRWRRGGDDVLMSSPVLFAIATAALSSGSNRS